MKKFIETKLLNTKQSPAELSPWIIPLLYQSSYQKCLPRLILLVASTRYELSCYFSQTFGGNTVDGKESHTAVTNSPPGKPPSRNRIFHVINQYKLHLKLYSLLLYHFLLTSEFMYTYIMLILVNRWLLNPIFNVTKALNGQNSSKWYFHHPLSTPFNALCFPLDSLPFLFQTS